MGAPSRLLHGLLSRFTPRHVTSGGLFGRSRPIGRRSGYAVKTPEVVSLATWFAWTSVNQRLPSGPVAMLYGTLLRVVATGYSVMSPTVARALPLNTIGSAANSTNSLAAPNTPWPSREVR